MKASGRVDKAYHGFMVIALLERINLGYCFGIGGIAANAPYRIGRVKDEAALAEHRNGILDIFCLIHEIDALMVKEGCAGNGRIRHAVRASACH